MKKSYGVIGCIVKCEDCSWGSASYKNAQALAARHAKAHGHKVIGEVTNAFDYDGRGDKHETGGRDD